MPEDKSLGSKLLGLFVEKEQGAPPEGAPTTEGEQSAADLVAELAQPRVPKPTGPVTPATVDFDVVFKNAGMDPQELDRVRKAEELLRSLPEATPNDVKRQIVEASLKAFGFEIAKIVAASQNQLKALETYGRLNEQQTAKSVADMRQQIAQLEDKVISLKAEIDTRAQALASTAAAAEQRRAQVQRVLEFFRVAPPPAAPKT